MRGTYGPFVSVSALAFVASGVLFLINPKWGGPPVAATQGPATMTAPAVTAEPAKPIITTPPVAKRIDHSITTKFGATRVDPYYWLKEKENADVLAYLEAENAYAEGQLSPLKPTQDEVYKELDQRLSAADQEVPYRMGGYLYQERYDQGADYPKIVRKKDTPGAAEEVVLDVTQLAQSSEQYNLNAWDVSPDGTKVAFAVDFSGNRIHEIFVRDLVSGTVTPTGVKDGDGSIVWTTDGQAFLYGRVDEMVRTNQIKRHRLADPVASDTVLFQEDDTIYSLSLHEARSRQMAIIGVDHLQRNELLAVSLSSPDPKPVMLVPRGRNVQASAEHFDGKFYILSNEGAPDKQITAVPDRDASAPPVVVVPEVKGHFIEGFTIVGNKIALQEVHDAVTTVRTVDLASGEQVPIAMGELGSTTLEKNEDAALPTLRVSFTNEVTPETLYEVNLATRASSVLKQDPAFGWFDPTKYATERVVALAKDGSQVPVTVLYRKDLRSAEGGNPTLVYAYGSYGSSSTPFFPKTWISLVDRGFVFAIAHVRGGREMGDAWYQAGRMANKMNTFTDFIAASEALVQMKYAKAGKIYARGGSAGGLLMGAIANLRPDLYDGIVAEVPFVDVLTTMLDDTIPLTTFEYEEWGNPNIPEQYNWMAAYSPYDNVKPQAYPPLFVAAGLHDSQVGYFEPAKWVAKLRATSTGQNPILFLTNMGAGHQGDSGRTGVADERSKIIAWLLDRAAK